MHAIEPPDKGLSLSSTNNDDDKEVNLDKKETISETGTAKDKTVPTDKNDVAGTQNKTKDDSTVSNSKGEPDVIIIENETPKPSQTKIIFHNKKENR